MAIDKNDVLDVLEQKNDRLEELGVKRIGIFGSFKHGEQNEESDIDFLVEFKEGEKSFRNFMELRRFLKELFQKEVDLATEQSLKSSIKSTVMEDVEYAKTA